MQTLVAATKGKWWIAAFSSLEQRVHSLVTSSSKHDFMPVFQYILLFSAPEWCLMPLI
jgi:hypothetical protein